MKKAFLIIIALILITGSFALFGQQTDKVKVTIYAGIEEERIAAYKTAIEQLYPDVELDFVRMSTGKLAARILGEGEATNADIIFGLPSVNATMIKNAGLVQPFETKNEYLLEITDPDSVIIPNDIWSGVFLVNPEELAKYNLPEPKSYQDLLNPIYKGHIVMTNPKSSGTGYFFLLGLLNLYGEEEGWAYFDKLKENIQMFGDSGSTPTKMTISGEAAIGLGMDFDGIQKMDAGKPIKVIFPEEGSPYSYDTVMLVKKETPVSPQVREVMEFITSAKGYEIAQNQLYIPVRKYEVNRQDDYPEELKLLNMEHINDTEYRDKLLTEWSNRYD